MIERIVYKVELLSAFKFFTAFRSAVSGISTLDKWLSRSANTYEIGAISDISTEYFSGSVKPGHYVIGEAYFSKYAHTFIPDAYYPSVPGKALEKINKIIYEGNTVKTKRSTLVKPISYPLPVQAMPNIGLDGNITQIGFLYPTSFSGFSYNNDPELTQKASENPNEIIAIKIPLTSKPIPIVFRDDCSDKLGKIIKFKAKVSEIPSAFESEIFNELGIYATEIFQLAYKPYLPGVSSLCLNVLDDNSYMEEKGAGPESVEAALFLQSHIEDYSRSERIDQMISESVHNCAIFPKSFIYGKENCCHFVTRGNVRISFHREKGIFDFYILTDLNSNDRFSKDLREIQEFYRKTSRNLEYQLASYGEKRKRNRLDFLFDYKRQSLFTNNKGVLESQEVESVIKSDPQFVATKAWLRGDML